MGLQRSQHCWIQVDQHPAAFRNRQIWSMSNGNLKYTVTKRRTDDLDLNRPTHLSDLQKCKNMMCSSPNHGLSLQETMESPRAQHRSTAPDRCVHNPPQYPSSPSPSHSRVHSPCDSHLRHWNHGDEQLMKLAGAWGPSLYLLAIPSGKHTKNYGKSPFLIGKSTINSHFQ